MYDLVIVGGGIAGLCAALEAPESARIVVLDKGEAAAGSSPLAQGGLAAAVGAEDSPELHATDTVLAGAGICDSDVVADICGEGPRAVDWLVSLGCGFERSHDGSLDLAREGGQSVARSVHWRDATGQEIVRALRAAVRGRTVERARVRASSLILRDGRCVGVMAGRGYAGRRTLLATGGAGALWAATTNASGATGDGIGVAIQAGAQVADLEFMQFHPTALAAGGSQRVLLTEALRGDGATLIDERGERFVDELAPRHVVTKAILERGRAFLDCRHLERLEERFPTVMSGARRHGFDPATQPLPVAPAAHYFIGGVAADAYGRTSIPGLHAAGECAASGMHGANRMAGNSLLETVVVGRRVGAAVEDDPALPEGLASSVPGRAVADVPPEIPPLMWEGCGPIRDAGRLRRAWQSLNDIHATASQRAGPTELLHVTLAYAIVRAATDRLESRGVHIRDDFPDADPAFAARSFDRAVHA